MDGLAVVARLLLAVVFAISGVAKLRDRAGTRRAVEGFGLPEPLVGPVAGALPLIECATAAALVPGISARAGALAAIALLVAFIVGISVNLAQGRRPDCHCFGQLHSAPVGPWTLVRNAVLAVAAAIAGFGAGADAGGSVAAAIGDLDGTGIAISVVSLAAIVAGLFVLGSKRKDLLAGSQPVMQAPEGPPVGGRAPDFSLASSAGGDVSLTDLLARGKKVLLVFFSPSCAPCRRIAPELARWQRELPGRLTVAVLSSGTEEKVQQSTEEYEIGEILIDEGGVVAKRYGSLGTPGAVLIGASGDVAAGYAGGEGPMGDLLIEAFGLTELVAAVAADKEAADSHDHRHDDAAETPEASGALLDPGDIDASYVPVARSDVSIGEHEGETVLIDRGSGGVHLLNPTAALVWQCLDGTGTIAEIVGDIADVFGQGPGEVMGAVLEVVRRFGRQGLLAGVGIASDQSPSEATTLQETSRNAE
ncbi:MAG: PqqD family peptide modification chaperone [Actinomycetota bacterium]